MTTGTHTLPPEAVAAINDALRVNYEAIIRDQAGTVVGLVRSRLEHPSYGTTKAEIRSALQRMNGSIGSYMVLFGQATHASIWSLAKFADESTEERVALARRAEASL